MDTLAKRLIDHYQRDIPLTARPYQAMAQALGVTETEVIHTLGRMRDNDIISRVGPVFDHTRAGASMLAAAAVAPDQLARMAERINTFEGVNHNYAREHEFNLWFVVTAPDEAQLQETLTAIEAATGLDLLALPMEHAYHIDLGFPIEWPDDRWQAEG